MASDLGNQGSRPGNTYSERQKKARTGAFAGKQYPQDAQLHGQRVGDSPRNAGQGTAVVKKTALAPEAQKRTGNDPWERPGFSKPGAQ